MSSRRSKLRRPSNGCAAYGRNRTSMSTFHASRTTMFSSQWRSDAENCNFMMRKIPNSTVNLISVVVPFFRTVLRTERCTTLLAASAVPNTDSEPVRTCMTTVLRAVPRSVSYYAFRGGRVGITGSHWYGDWCRIPSPIRGLNRKNTSGNHPLA